MKTKLFMIMCLLLSLGFGSQAQAANADWEWSRDKGWTIGLGKAQSTPSEQLKYAWKMEKDGRYMNASKQYFLLLKTFPDSEEAGIGLQRLANCLFLMENYYDSYKALEQVIKTYPLSAKKSDLIKIEFLIGRKFQQGARKDLLNDQEPMAVSRDAAIEIYKSVIDNDPVGPYAGSATLAIGYCYKDLNQPKMGIVYTDRVITEFSMSAELVAKARILKKTLEVLEGKSSVDSVKTAIRQADAIAKDNKGDSGQGDFAPVTDYKQDIKELEEAQAKKLWDAAQFYKSRGSRESITAYKFSLEQLIIRMPNTSYAQKARRIIGDVKIPPKTDTFGKFNLPLISKKKEPTFIVQPNSSDYVETTNIPVPGANTSADSPLDGGSVAMAKPATPPALHVTPGNNLPQAAAANPFANTAADPKTPTATATPAGKSNANSKPIASTTNPPKEIVSVENDAGNLPKISQNPGNSSPVPVRHKKSLSSSPPGESGASIMPGAITRNTPVIAASQNNTQTRTIQPATNRSVTTTSAASYRGQTPPDSGSSVFPAAIRKTAAPTNQPVTSEPTPSTKIAPITENPAAESKARSTANDAAAKNNNWNFSEEFK